jgi:FkbM family methyltransferase
MLLGMMKNISYFLYKIIFFVDSVLKKLIGKSFLLFFKDFIHNDSYKSINILDKNITFFTPNQILEWRVNTFFTKEPETLVWIDGFKKEDKIIFWDIGANIGLYSIYATLKHPNIEVVSFEPSTSNLRVLSRNISINNLEERIKINQLPLTRKENQYLTLEESEFIEGWAMNTFGEGLDFEGKRIISKNKYKVLGTNINYLLKNNILEIPDYIKIDVDGIEHLILEGADNYLGNKKIKSLSIEINENFLEQHESILKVMKKFNFKMKHKKHSSLTQNSKKFSKSFNYIFGRV